jgi:hypothetical protein
MFGILTGSVRRERDDLRREVTRLSDYTEELRRENNRLTKESRDLNRLLEIAGVGVDRDHANRRLAVNVSISEAEVTNPKARAFIIRSVVDKLESELKSAGQGVE